MRDWRRCVRIKDRPAGRERNRLRPDELSRTTTSRSRWRAPDGTEYSTSSRTDLSRMPEGWADPKVWEEANGLYEALASAPTKQL